MHEGKNLKKLFEKTGLTKIKFSESIGYTRNHLYNLFQEEVLPYELIEKVKAVYKEDLREEKKPMIGMVQEPTETYGKGAMSIKITFEISGGDQKEQSDFIMSLDKYAKDYMKKLPKKRVTKK